MGFRIIAITVPIERYLQMILFSSLLQPWAGRLFEGVTDEFKGCVLFK
jgi:hypothetical protein